MISSPKVVVVEHDLVSRNAMRDALTARGYDVTTAVSAATALQAVERRAPRLVVLDDELPGTRGILVLRQIRSLGQNGDVAVIMTGTATDADALARVKELGAAHYLFKPVQLDMLVRHVEAILTGAGNGSSSSRGASEPPPAPRATNAPTAAASTTKGPTTKGPLASLRPPERPTAARRQSPTGGQPPPARTSQPGAARAGAATPPERTLRPAAASGALRPWRVEVGCAHWDGLVQLEVHAVSADKVFLCIEDAPSVYTKLDLHIHTPHGTVRAKGVVSHVLSRRRAQAKSQPPGMSVKLLETPQAAVAALRALLDAAGAPAAIIPSGTPTSSTTPTSSIAPVPSERVPRAVQRESRPGAASPAPATPVSSTPAPATSASAAPAADVPPPPAREPRAADAGPPVSVRVTPPGGTEQERAMVRPRKATSTAGAQQPKLPPTSPEEAAALRHDLTATLERLRPADARSRLGLPAGADRRSIKKAFLALSRQYHPDVFARHADAALSQLAEEVYLLISAAENELHKESKGGQGSTAPNHSGEIRSGRSTAPYPPVAGEPGGAAGPQRGNPRAADVEMTGAPPRRRSGTLPHAPTAGTGGASLRPAGRSTRPWTEGDPRGPAQGPPRLRRRQSEGARQTSPWGAEPAPPRGTAPRDPSRPGADQTGPFRAQRHDSSGDRHEPTADQTGPFRVPPAGAVHPGRRRWTSPAHGMPRVRYSDDAASLPLESSPGPLGRGGGDARQAEPHEAGFVALDEGRYRDARNLFSLAVKLSPNNVSYRAALELARGYLLKERGSLDEAAEHFQRALTHDPKSVRAKKELHEHAKRSEASGGFFSRLFKR